MENIGKLLKYLQQSNKPFLEIYSYSGERNYDTYIFFL